MLDTLWRTRILLLFQLFAIALFVSWLILLCIKPVRLFPDSYTYLATADNLGDTSSGRPILFPLLLLITNKLHLKQSIVCYLIQILSMAGLFWFCGPRKKLLSLTNIGILIACFLTPAIWSYCGSCLTESILFPVEIWIVILLSFLFFPKRPTSLVMAIVYSVAISLLAILLKPWIMLYIIGCSVLLAAIAWFSKAFRSARMPALILFIVGVGAFVFSYRYNMNKTASSANIAYLLTSSDKMEDLKARLQETKDRTSEEARFMNRIIDDLQLLKTKYNGDPFLAPTEELKVFKINEPAYRDTANKAFRIAYFQRKKDVINLMRLSFERYINGTQSGLSCLVVCYGPYIGILKKNGVCFAIAFTGLTLIYRLIQKHRNKTLSFKKKPSAHGIQLLIFVGVLLFTSIFFALFLTISGGVELSRTVLPAVLFQLIAISYLIINRHELMVTKL